ncbi:MAG: 3-hydroxybutyryl-CoA dehydrogenase [Firmicutes bacterium]|nr:3-hydroxybutyryl-CoA dehydrogenase [Bacillota bacterium]MCL5039271.1 3-hydroxybutyryl-CoA dehydrogenase [Bacillota bacterium]
MEIGTIAVIGAGQMGSGIAQVAAQAGYRVILRDIKEEFVARGISLIKGNLTRSVDKGKLAAEERESILGRINSTVDLGPVAQAQVVIEAIVESLGQKRELFAVLDGLCPPETVFASNTSSLPITELASTTQRPDRFIGMHFMNPVPVMKLVEIIKGMATSEETFASVKDLAEKMGKTTVAVNDYPGFVSNRILLPMINEAIFCLYEGVASAEDIDNVMKLGMNHPMGPLALADLIGLDTCLSIMEVLYEGFRDSKYRPCPLLRKMVKAGYLGRKTGRGFYQY